MKHEHKTQGLVTPKLALISLVLPKSKTHKFANVKSIDSVNIPQLFSDGLLCHACTFGKHNQKKATRKIFIGKIHNHLINWFIKIHVNLLPQHPCQGLFM
jgi:hypothetical protein